MHFTFPEISAGSYNIPFIWPFSKFHLSQMVAINKLLFGSFRINLCPGTDWTLNTLSLELRSGLWENHSKSLLYSLCGPCCKIQLGQSFNGLADFEVHYTIHFMQCTRYTGNKTALNSWVWCYHHHAWQGAEYLTFTPPNIPLVIVSKHLKLYHI